MDFGSITILQRSVENQLRFQQVEFERSIRRAEKRKLKGRALMAQIRMRLERFGKVARDIGLMDLTKRAG